MYICVCLTLVVWIVVEDLPVFALQDDRVVEVAGEPTSVHKALELIASHLRKFLVDRSIIPYFENQVLFCSCLIFGNVSQLHSMYELFSVLCF